MSVLFNPLMYRLIGVIVFCCVSFFGILWLLDNDTILSEKSIVQGMVPEVAEQTDAQEPVADGYSSEEKTAIFSAEYDFDPYTEFGSVQAGDTAEKILTKYMSRSMFYEMLNVSESVHSLAKLRVGKPYTVVRSAENSELERFEYEIDRDNKLVIACVDDQFMASLEAIEYDVDVAVIHGRVESSLFEGMIASGENPELAIFLADIFASEIDFVRDLREEDNFALVVEKRFRDGEFDHYGRILAARFVNQDLTYEGFLFMDSDKARYFNANGESLNKAFLKAPLSITRITSGYSMTRKHPILKVTRPHQGIDYGAPSGTPVMAIGDGVVTRASWAGGYGNLIVLRHANGLESMYAHLSKYAKGIKGNKGRRVSQGEIIGYVGSTGLSTGPHLDFRIKKNGQFVNPLKLVTPRHKPVSKENMIAFLTHKNNLLDLLEGKLTIAEYVNYKTQLNPSL